MPLKWPLMQMEWNVCPQIFTQSFRRLCSNWCRKHLARLQHINYFHCFSKLIEYNYYSFALINRMLNTNTIPVTVARKLWEVISKIKSVESVAIFHFLSLYFFLSCYEWQCHRSTCLWCIMQQIKYDSKGCRHHGECEETELLYTHK